jgi:hypothetical protein
MSEHTQERGIKVTMIREVTVMDYSGEHSTKTHEAVGAHIIFLTEDGLEPKGKETPYTTFGEWKVIKP